MLAKTKEVDSALPAQPTAQNIPAGPKGPPSIINGELIVRGALISQGDVQIDGRVEGDIRAASLVVGDKVRIIGDGFVE